MKEIRFLAAAALGALVLLAPVIITDAYFRNVLVLCCIYALMAVALDMLVGFLGIDSFGHAAFFGGGAYVTAILMRQYEWSFWLALPAGGLFAGVLGWVVSIPALRMRGVYFAIATLACAEIVRLVVVNVPSVTRGTLGLTVPAPNMSWVPDGQESVVYYYLAVFLLALTCGLFHRFIRSVHGRALIAVRENEPLASTVGVPAIRYKAAVFTASALVCGFAGGIYAPFVGILTPDVLGVGYSALALLMVVVGGKGTIYGAILGAAMFTVVTEFFRIASDLRMILFAVLLVVSIMLTPKGVIAPLIHLIGKLLSRRTSVESVAGEAKSEAQP